MLDMVNTSITQGVVSSNLKNAILQPLLKKKGLDLIFKNYRPVSNLAFLGKVIEKVICNHLMTYTESTNKTEKYQAAYREHHSTETALLRVKADLLAAMDKQEVTCLVLLDLSAAFDTISHNLLLNHLKFCFWHNGYGSAMGRELYLKKDTASHGK